MCGWSFVPGTRACEAYDSYTTGPAQQAGGARIIGGCCGIGPAHIERLRQALA